MLDSKLTCKIRRIPAVPGVYLFKSGDEIIYIGKAKVLKDRVRSYFLPGNTDPKVAAIVSKTSGIEWIVTDSDVEALILENTLIKKHKPRYNIDLKDNKRYPFLKITVNEPFPRIEVVRAIERDNAKYFGPYVDAGSMRRTLQILERVLKIRTCKTALPAPAGKRTCLNFQIGKCQGLCAGNVSETEYSKRVKNAVLLLVGRNRALLAALEKEMQEASRSQEFERAAALRDGIRAVQRVMVRQRMSFGDIEDRDVIAHASEGRDCCAAVFQVREGVVAGRHHFFMRLALGEGEGEIIASFLQGYYRRERHIPCEIMIAAEPPDCAVLETWLSAEAGKTVRILVPQKGEKAKLVELCRKNASFLLNDFLVQKGKQDGEISVPLQFLKKDLDLPFIPRLCRWNVTAKRWASSLIR